MKKFVLSLLFLIAILSESFGQCAFNNTLISTITPTCPGSTTVPCITGGQYVQVNVVAGNSYTFYTCGGATWDTQITLYDAAGTTSLGYSDDACGLQSSVAWTATYTGVLNVLVDNYPCTNGSTCATLTISCSLPPPPPPPCIGGSNNTCSTADPFCTGISYNYCNTTGVPSLGTYGCLWSTPNPMWMYLNVSTSGNIDIQIQQYNNSSVGIDVDFALYGPYASLAASCPINGSTPQVDCSYSSSFTETANIVGAVAGQWYILLITNYSNQSGYIQFSQIGGGGTTNCSVLPIELLTFEGRYQNGYNLLKWSTATETNNDYFKIERSVDGFSWIEIGQVTGAGSSSTIKEYSFKDIKFEYGVNYYRLTQVDYNGGSESFNIVVIDNTTEKPTIVKVTNLMGQEVSEEYDGLRIVYYSNGAIIKKVGK